MATQEKMARKFNSVEAKWKPIPVNLKLASSEEFHGFAGIEELTNYELTKVDRKGQVRTERKAKTKRKKKQVQGEKNKKPKLSEVPAEEAGSDNDCEIDMSLWENLFVPKPILRALAHLGFTAPTPIQTLVLPSAVRDRMDIIGAAETGSGKTLAFGIPILNNVLRTKDENSERCLSALILTPTRELAIQVKTHLQAAAKFTDIKVVAVVGGMAQQKQERLLKRRPDIVVATPGRLWELIQEGNPHLSQLDSLHSLVVDEADRMTEKGHFKELSEIVSLANSNEGLKKRRQNFVFSATLTMLHDVPKRVSLKKRTIKLTQDVKIESIATMVGMKDKRKVFDLSRKTGTVETLTEAKLDCTVDEKDLYLYYFLCTYPGRTLVFTNSIDGVRRLKDVFELLKCNPLPLHADMHQRQRLKNLDRFRANERGLLLATDVAARGLDIPGVQHVIQYDVPRTAENYVHRSGRTARAQKEGLNLTLVDPRDGVFYRKLCRTLNREKALPTFPVDSATFKAVQQRVDKARRLSKLEYQRKKMSSQTSWLINAAQELDVEIEDKDLLRQMQKKGQPTNEDRRIKILKKELNVLLSQQLTPRGFFSKFPTKMGHLNTLNIPDGRNAVRSARTAISNS